MIPNGPNNTRNSVSKTEDRPIQDTEVANHICQIFNSGFFEIFLPTSKPIGPEIMIIISPVKI